MENMENKPGMVDYRCVDAAHSSYICLGCGFVAEFEADGPIENGWTFCPSCGKLLMRVMERRDADEAE